MSKYKRSPLKRKIHELKKGEKAYKRSWGEELNLQSKLSERRRARRRKQKEEEHVQRVKDSFKKHGRLYHKYLGRYGATEEETIKAVRDSYKNKKR